jgi:PHD/YefM family antitoxin component YafN of YafNO toxin-antitoxin module
MKVSSADLVENFGAISDKALIEPVTITADGRERLVLISGAEYDRLKRRDRRAILVEDLSDDEMAEIAGQRVPEHYDLLNEELVAPTYDKMKSNPERGLSPDDVRKRLDTRAAAHRETSEP